VSEGTPFVVMALPRSRTHWLSRFLSYGKYHCWHEQTPHFRGLEDVQAWLSQDFTGASETTAAPFWRTILAARPDVRVFIVRRAVIDVTDSLMRLEMRGTCTFDRAKVERAMKALDRKLDQIEARVPGVLSVRYEDLAVEATCARVFEHCLGVPHDHAWWEAMDQQNLQADMPALMRYMFANKPATDKLVAMVKRHTLTSMRPRKTINRDDITIQQESCEVWYRDGKRLFEEHSVQLGDAPDGYLRRNWQQMLTVDRLGGMMIMTARCNGRMIGYWACYIARATDDATVTTAMHISIFAAQDFPGIGGRLQRAAIEALRVKGVGEVCFRAGVRADGARMGVLYERAGAEQIGEMYRLKLKRA